MASTELSTNQRLVAAVVRLLPLRDLPLREDVIALGEAPTGYVARRLAEEFLALAEKRSAEITEPPHTLAERMTQYAIAAADLAYDVRTVAQKGSAPHRHVWLLLVAVLTCLVIAADAEGGTVAREKLCADVGAVAASLTDL